MMDIKKSATNLLKAPLARLFWRVYARHACRLGLDRLYLLLSFDADTPQDIEAAAKLSPWLSERGIKQSYAVPGEQLRQGAEVYRRLASDGVDFINHGALPHTAWRGDHYESITFYHEMPPEAVVEDIRRGHEIVTEIIGKAPVGFRAPHFGLFQKPHQLKLQYDTLRALGYHYSSSTLPYFAMRRGPMFDVGRLWEIPVTGSYPQPFSILDSWSHLVSPNQPTLKNSYATLLIDTIDRLKTTRIPAVLNYYADPAHVIQGDAFYRAIEYAIQQGVQSLNYQDLLAHLSTG